MNQNRKYLVSSEIIQKVKDGDQEAFVKVYDAYFTKIFFIAKQFGMNDEEAKDMAHDVFVKVHKNIHTLNDSRAFHSWIYKVAYNTSVNYVKREKQLVDFGEGRTADDFMDQKLKEPLDEIEDRRILEIVEKSLNTMDESFKTVGLLRYFEGLKVDEISEILSVPRGTVKSRLNRIRKRLKRDLKQNGISPKTYGFVFMMPHLIRNAYQELFNQSATNASLSTTTAVAGGMAAQQGFAALLTIKNFAIFGIGTTAVIASAIVLNNPPKEEVIEKPVTVVEEPKPAEVVVENAKIDNITYNQNWTNTSIAVDVTTTNEEYDQIQIDGVETNTIDHNGTYQIQLIKDNTIIDQKELVIGNIDKNSPQVVSERNGNIFTVYLSDDLSAVNPNSVVMYRNNEISYEYTYDANTNTLTVSTKKGYNDKIYISDYAGNPVELLFE